MQVQWLEGLRRYSAFQRAQVMSVVKKTGKSGHAVTLAIGRNRIVAWDATNDPTFGSGEECYVWLDITVHHVSIADDQESPVELGLTNVGSPLENEFRTTFVGKILGILEDDEQGQWLLVLDCGLRTLASVDSLALEDCKVGMILRGEGTLEVNRADDFVEHDL
jgi:hypothetical protein